MVFCCAATSPVSSARTSGYSAELLHQPLAFSPLLCYAMKAFLSFSLLNQPLLASKVFFFSVSSCVSAFLELRPVKGLLWSRLWLKQMLELFNLLSRPLKLGTDPHWKYGCLISLTIHVLTGLHGNLLSKHSLHIQNMPVQYERPSFPSLLPLTWLLTKHSHF